MNALKRLRTCLLTGSVVGTLQPLQRLAEEPASTARDGRDDFDFEIGTWKTHLSRLLHPLTGSNTWVEYEGTTIVRKIWNGRGEFFDQETLNGRAILVRFFTSDITSNSWRFEQSFSDDGGKTWELNWIATDTRVTDESDKVH